MIHGILKMVTADKKAVHRLFERHTEGIRRRIQVTLPPHITRRIKHFGVCLAALEIFLRHVMSWSEVMIEEKMDELAEVIVRRMVQLDTDQFSGGERLGILQHFMNQFAAFQNKFLNTGRAGPAPQDLYGSIEGSLVFIIPGKLAEMMKPYDNARLVQAAEAVGGLMTREAGSKRRFPIELAQPGRIAMCSTWTRLKRRFTRKRCEHAAGETLFRFTAGAPPGALFLVSLQEAIPSGSGQHTWRSG